MSEKKENYYLLFHYSKIFNINTYKVESIIINSTLKKIDYASLNEFINIQPPEKQSYFFPLKKDRVIFTIEQLYQVSIANTKGDTYVNAEWIRYLQKTFWQIAQNFTIKFYVQFGSTQLNTTNTAFELQKQIVQIKFSLTKEQDFFGITTSLNLQNEWVNLEDCIQSEFFIFHNKKLYILTYTDCILLKYITEKLKIKKFSNFENFENLILQKIEIKYNVDKTNVFKPTIIEEVPDCQVQIRETLGTYIIITPKFTYGNITLPENYYNKPENYIVTLKGNPFIVNRDLKKEKEFYNLIQNFHPNFGKQTNGYFQINFGEAGKNKWFYKFFIALIEKQIDIIGIDFLQHFRYSSEKPVTKIAIIVEEHNKFTLDFELHYGKEVIPLQYLQKALRNGQHSFPLKDNSIAVLPPEWLQQYNTIVKHGTIEGKYLVVSKSFIVAQQLQPNQISPIEQNVIPDDWRKNWLEWQQKESHQLITANVKATLRDYQQKGMEWLYLLSQIGAGALLADDMGLGKTLQTIAYLQHYCTLHTAAKHLVIAPASLLYNWQNEIEKFAPTLKVAVHYGVQRNWQTIQNENAQIVLTTYSIGRNDIEQLQSIYWNTIVLDESHNIKNPDALTTKAITQMEAGFKICLSGTPVMNNTMDLYAQFNFLLPSFFYSRSFFKQEYAIPIDDEKDEEKLAILQKLTNPYILRRTKQQVATELPPKVESTIWCILDEAQRTQYDNIKEENWNNLQTNIAAEGLQKSRMQILTTLLRLRQVCDSPLLLPQELQTTTESAKLTILVNEIKNNTGNSKVVVFSQFVKMMDLLKEAFDDNGISYQSFDGGTSAKERSDLVNQFQQKEDDTKVFLISLKAGAVGITLTEAEYVFIVDPWWNKAIENQAVDRIHRIGQTKHIFAYKMICKNTIEERIMQLQERKSNLSDSLIQIEEDFVKQLTEDDLKFLFS